MHAAQPRTDRHNPGRSPNDCPGPCKSVGDNSWRTIAAGSTDKAGCIQGFVSASLVLPVGNYRLLNETTEYFAQQNISSVYPEIVINFFLANEKRLVLPSLLGPYSYTTYRGSQIKAVGGAWRI